MNNAIIHYAELTTDSQGCLFSSKEVSRVRGHAVVIGPSQEANIDVWFSKGLRFLSV